MNNHNPQDTSVEWERNWKDDFDREYAGAICDGAGIADQSTREDIKDFIEYLLTQSHQQGYKEGLDDMFLEIAELAEPDERQPSAGDLHTNMDDIYEIKKKLLKDKQL